MAEQVQMTTLWVLLCISWSDGKASPKSSVMGNAAREKGVCVHTYALTGAAWWSTSLCLGVYRTLWLPPQPGAVLYLGLLPARLLPQASR